MKLFTHPRFRRQKFIWVGLFLLLVGTATTARSGQWFFNNANIMGGLNSNNPYVTRVLNEAMLIWQSLTISHAAGVCTDPNKISVDCDFDGDEVLNLADLDDDNDGILDVTEAVTATQTVSKTGVTASMTLTAGAGNISMLLNGADGDNFWYNNGQNIANQTIAQFDFPAATLLQYSVQI